MSWYVVYFLTYPVNSFVMPYDVEMFRHVHI